MSVQRYRFQTLFTVVALMTNGLSATSYAAGATLEEVVVTARKRAESLQDVPISLTTFTASQLDNFGATSLIDLKNHIPGFHYSDRGNLQTEITIRGVGGNARNVGTDSGVGLYVDGVYAGRTSAYNQDLVDIEQVEVLRGPQGTLFGKNTTGGAVNITSKKPGEDTEMDLRLRVGNYNEIRTRGSIAGKLGEGVYGKITAATWDRDGYLDNIAGANSETGTVDDYQSQERRAARAQLRLVPSDALEMNFSVDFTKDDRDAVLNQVVTWDWMNVNVDQPNRDQRDMWGASANIEYQINDTWSFVSITGYRDVQIDVSSDIDQLPINIASSGPFTDDAELFTQEFRLAFDGGGPLRGILGFYYFDQEGASYRSITIAGNGLVDDHRIETTSTAMFANVDYDLSDSLQLTLGARYTDETKDAFYNQTSAVFPTMVFPLKVSDSALSWTTSLNKKWTEDLSTYVTVSRGFKSGGMDLDTSTALLEPEALVYDPEYVTNYEVGLKADLFEGKARLTAAAFLSDYKDRQVTRFLTFGDNPVAVPTTNNAGESEVKGLEIELQAIVTEQLTLWASAAFMDGEYTRFLNATPDGADFSGNTTERTPESFATLGAEYRIPFESGNVVIYADVSRSGAVELQADNLPIHRENGYTLVNARAGWEANEGAYGVYLWAKNITDEQYMEFSRSFLGNQQVLYGEPSMYGLEVNYRF